MSKKDEDIYDLAEQDAKKAKKTPDIAKVRKKACELRDLLMDKAELEEQLQSIQAKINEIEQRDLPDLFAEVGISFVGVDADGNHPAFLAERKTVYGAKIPDEFRQKALTWFENSGNGDLVKALVTVQFGMQEHKKRLALLKLLSSNDYQARTDETIHPQTLKAFVKRELEVGHQIPMDLLGAFMMDVVKIKPAN